MLSCSALYYGDGATPFFWLGDSVWSAPAVEIDAQLHGGTQRWSQYLATRSPYPPTTSTSRFTAIHVAPADYFGKLNDPDVFFAQPAGFCTVPAGHQGSYPNLCSIPKPAYWNAFDGIISQATQQDLLVVIAGLMHPLDTNPYPKFPSKASVERFSRYLAARMAGFPVMFSPGFDTSVSGTVVDGSTKKQVMDASGKAIQIASPRALITNHLNGQATCTDYKQFSDENPLPDPWMTVFLFQSGHALNQNGVPGTTCPGYISTDGTAVRAAMRRAVQIPKTLVTYSPSLPSINGEGPYDDPTNNNPPAYSQVNMRYRVRQAANLTSLSNSQGFTYGVTQLGVWTNPQNSWSLDSARFDMRSLGDRFKPYAGLPNHSEWIVNNPTAYDQQRALASNGSMVAIAYLPPANPASPGQNQSITLSTGGLPGLGCPNTGSPWTLTWQTPTTNFTVPVQPSECSIPASGQITIKSPPCSSAQASPECDWVLLMTKTSSAAVAAPKSTSLAATSIPARVDVWTDMSTGDGTSAILAQITRTDSRTATIEVSPSGFAFQDGVRVASVPSGYFVIWHADGLDGSLLGVFGQRFDGGGNLIGPTSRLNSTTEHDQRDPAIAADITGNVVVVWSSYGQDSDRGGIYGQLLDANGRFVGGEFPISSLRAAGHQARPQVVYLPSGGFVVGWTTEAIGADLGALSLRLFDSKGSPIVDEIRIPGTAVLNPELVDLEPDADGGFSLRWLLRDGSRASVTSYLQRFTAQGMALGARVTLP